LSSNRIQSIETKTFETLNELESLYLNDNQIKEVSIDFSTSFKRFKLLNFASNNCSIPSFPENSLKQIETEIIANCPAPFELICAFSNESTICSAINLVYTRPAVKVQAFDANEVGKFIVDRQLLKFIPHRLAETFPKLERILILRSQLSSLTSKSFEDLVRLKYIEILGNNLKSIDADTFDAVPQLEYLDLSSNHIRSLPKQVFVRLTLLTELRLSHNNIKVLESNVLPPNNLIKVFQINSNELEKVSTDEVNCLREFSEEIDFRGNRCVDTKLSKSKNLDLNLKNFAELLDKILLNCR
jgi:Leucine-rich repeat (LRR) protein